MSGPDYKITGREVDPVAFLLKSVVEINWYLDQARQQGWSVELEVEEGVGRLGVSIHRNDCWPTETSEAEAKAEVQS